MKKIGSIMVFYGVFAIILNFFNAVPRLMFWIYSWGETLAWVIKIAFVVVGGAMWLMANKSEEKQEVENSEN